VQSAKVQDQEKSDSILCCSVRRESASSTLLKPKELRKSGAAYEGFSKWRKPGESSKLIRTKNMGRTYLEYFETKVYV
jgi:hypothetical protein